MSTISWTEGGRQVTLINRTSKRIGVCGVTIGPFHTMSIPLRRIIGHRTYMSTLKSLKSAGVIDVQLNLDILNTTDLQYLDAPLSGEIQMVRDVFNAVVAIDRNGFKVSFQTLAAAHTYSGADLDGVIGQGNVDYARNVTIYSDCNAGGGGKALDGKTIVVTGVDINDQQIQEGIAVAEIAGPGGASTTQGNYAFKRITSIYIPADTKGARGYYEFGTGKKLGLSRPVTQGALIKEFTDNAVPGVAGTLALYGTGKPNGTYSPNDDPVHSYIIYYIPN